MSNQAVDTNGWHTVAAVHYADLNRAILAEGKTPPGFDIAASDGSAQAKGTFGPWSLQTGGSGPLIMMALPITGGTITIGGKATPITPCTATVKITASFLDEGTLKHTLQNDQTVPVSVESCLPKQPGFMGEAVLVELLGMWLNQNLGEFNAVFGAVDLDAEYVSEGLSWLKPSFKGYGVAEHAINPTLENSTFAILCLIDDQAPPDGLANMVSPYAIPDGCDAAFLLSPDKFLTHMMLASTPLMFQNIDNDPAGDHFVIDNQGTRISSTSSLTLKPFRLSGGKLVDSAVIDAGAPYLFVINFTASFDACGQPSIIICMCSGDIFMPSIIFSCPCNSLAFADNIVSDAIATHGRQRVMQPPGQPTMHAYQY